MFRCLETWIETHAYGVRKMSKVCAVFGGSRGIGNAVVTKFAEDGHKIAVISRNKESVDRTIQELVQKGLKGPHLGVSCDVSDEKGVQATIKSIQDTLGHIDILVNSAGVNKDALLLKTSTTDMTSLLQTNLVGPMLTCRAVVRSMVQRRAGSIINVGSIIGVKGNPGQCVYSASKSGLQGFTKSLAKEVASRGVRVNLIVPGFINTDMTSGMSESIIRQAVPLQRLGTPEEVATAVRFLAYSPYITGTVLVVDGGMQLNI
ncbi:carbonyl reductase family member 4-like isoform X1 [Branchiostoma floridae]|uniref:3-ketoacyl-[acyl-carrier-protein] reductase beta subunit n=1 Tax=Branchiostoma floridae TaxID=7739 RepID=A0A9J7HXF9_BRAFL|nr:carbonyl reductase family member 4-like isoform X1 [Branchiostoma floridae]